MKKVLLMVNLDTDPIRTLSGSVSADSFAGFNKIIENNQVALETNIHGHPIIQQPAK